MQGWEGRSRDKWQARTGSQSLWRQLGRHAQSHYNREVTQHPEDFKLLFYNFSQPTQRQHCYRSLSLNWTLFSDQDAHCKAPWWVCRQRGGAGSSVSLTFQMEERLSQAAFMLICRTGRETALCESEILPEEAVVIMCGRNQTEETA